MLRQILLAFDGDDVLSSASLARQLGVGEALLKDMLDELVRMGYLAENDQCSTSCDGCGHASACETSNAQRMWLLTVKGRQVLRERV